MPRNIVFSPEAFDELSEWIEQDKKIAIKIMEFIVECGRTPFEGKGKPEPLKGNRKEFWSRRITQEHRLVYKVTDEHVYILSCHGHYE